MKQLHNVHQWHHGSGLSFHYVPIVIQHPAIDHLEIPEPIFSTRQIPPHIVIKYIPIFNVDKQFN